MGKNFIPKINCGLFAGDSPMYWEMNHGHVFYSEEECKKWIDDNKYNFTANELSGGIYPQEIYPVEVELEYENDR